MQNRTYLRAHDKCVCRNYHLLLDRGTVITTKKFLPPFKNAIDMNIYFFNLITVGGLDDPLVKLITNQVEKRTRNKKERRRKKEKEKKERKWKLKNWRLQNLFEKRNERRTYCKLLRAKNIENIYNKIFSHDGLVSRKSILRIQWIDMQVSAIDSRVWPLLAISTYSSLQPLTMWFE